MLTFDNTGDKARKETKSYLEFYKDYGFFFKEGIITSNDQYEKEEIAKLLRFESSQEEAGKLVSLTDYNARMRAGQRDVYYLAAPSRQLAEASPYFEAMKKKDVEVLFCFESYDELVLMQLQQFNKLKIKVNSPGPGYFHVNYNCCFENEGVLLNVALGFSP